MSGMRITGNISMDGTAPDPRGARTADVAYAPGWRSATVEAEGTLELNDLIDTTEMYLRTIFELEEEGIIPLRARIAERLGQSGPTVSQTVARMERDGLVTLTDDRHLELTAEGRQRATAVMRKHRLAERLLLDVIGLDWADVHVEACRWEHVMSEEVERRLVALLDRPRTSPYGNPIPGMAEIGVAEDIAHRTHTDLISLTRAAETGTPFMVDRIIEVVQNQPDVMRRLHAAGIRPGTTVTATVAEDGIRVGEANTLPVEITDGIHGHTV